MKNIVLLVTAAGDSFLSSRSSRKVLKNTELEAAIKHVIDNRQNTSPVVNFHFPSETFSDTNVFENVAPTKLVKTILHNSSILSKDNELTIVNHDNEDMLFDGDAFGFLFRPCDYDVHMLGIDINGVFAPTITDLLAKGYHVTLYSDVSRPFKTNYKFINNLAQKNKSKFRFCSYKSAT